MLFRSAGVTATVTDTGTKESITKTLGYSEVQPGETDEHTRLRATAQLLIDVEKSLNGAIARKRAAA